MTTESDSLGALPDGTGSREPSQRAVSALRASIPNAIVEAMKRCPDYADFPTAWAIQQSHGATLEHHPRCSSVPGWDPLSGPGFLCDCNAIQDEWRRIRDLLDLVQPNGGVG